MPIDNFAATLLPEAESSPPRRRVAENAHDYPYVIVDFGDGYRVIECAAGIQWIVQKLVRGNRPWVGQSFCRTKEALLRTSGHPDHPALVALPDRFLEGRRVGGGAQPNEFASAD
jgi:hypothetical protein